MTHVDENSIRSTLHKMSDTTKKDIFALCRLAEKNVPSAVERIKEIFGECSPYVLWIASSVCYKSLSPSEQDYDYNTSLQDLNYLSSVGPARADEVLKERSSGVIPLLAIRTRKGISRRQLAKDSGVNERQIQRIERGEAKAGNVTSANLVAIADALGVDIHELL